MAPRSVSVVPARFDRGEGGVPFSAEFADIYHSTALCRAWPAPISGFHRIHFEGGRIALTLVLGDVAESLPQVEARADALFLDGFAPARNSAMWSPQVVRELARIAAPGCTLATW